MADGAKITRFRDRLSFASTSAPTTPAQARRLNRPEAGEGAGQAHRFVARVARRQRAMRVQRVRFRADCRPGRGVVWRRGL